MEKRGQATFFIKKLPVPIMLYLIGKLIYKSLCLKWIKRGQAAFSMRGGCKVTALVISEFHSLQAFAAL